MSGVPCRGDTAATRMACPLKGGEAAQRRHSCLCVSFIGVLVSLIITKPDARGPSQSFIYPQSEALLVGLSRPFNLM